MKRTDILLPQQQFVMSMPVLMTKERCGKLSMNIVVKQRHYSTTERLCKSMISIILWYCIALLLCRFAISVTVDLNHHSSPLVPVLPIVHWSLSNRLMFYYTAAVYGDNPLDFSLGTASDYRSAQAGSPQVCCCVLMPYYIVLFPRVSLSLQ